MHVDESNKCIHGLPFFIEKNVIKILFGCRLSSFLLEIKTLADNFSLFFIYIFFSIQWFHLSIILVIDRNSHVTNTLKIAFRKRTDETTPVKP